MAAINDGPHNLTIANGGTTSNSLSAATGMPSSISRLLGALIGFTIYGPSALTGTVTVKVLPVGGGSTWYTLNDSGADVTCAAAKATAVRCGGIADIRLESSGAEGAERVFQIVLQFDVSK